MDILISGMGIAGPTLAWWLLAGGHTPVVVEEAAELRRGGYVIDFWGAGYDVAERMGLIPRLREVGYMVEEVRFVDSRGRRTGGFSAEVFQRSTRGRYVSLPRSELSAAIHDTLQGRVETLWNDCIRSIGDVENGLAVSFRSAPPRRFDLVIGADGLHSNVRRLRFGPEKQFEKYLGYKVGAFDVGGYRPRDENVYLSYNEPGRQLARFSMRNDRTLFLFVYEDPSPDVPAGDDPAGAKAELRRRFGGKGWETSAILEAMEGCDRIYFDRVSQVQMSTWSSGRACLVGDAAACPSLIAGEGAALAMASAYVLAGELVRAGAGYNEAFARYEEKLRPFLEHKQKAARDFASSFAPKTRFGIALRNLVTRAFGIPFVADHFLGAAIKDNFDLPEYVWGGGSGNVTA